MRTLTLESEPVAVDVEVDEAALRVILDDGRELSVPLAWFPRLLHGTPEQRAQWELVGHGEGLHWTPSPRTSPSPGSWPDAVTRHGRHRRPGLHRLRL